ncbi:wax ester/triacylglycerol synthase domain-containing protein [Geodermatophilus bullaregiensis]|uniref:wax ester/triacylglycerol synthase domain-containing protein n=1 Tax=Geodermatophilus bullaregiensis TaxID=1564160 RepID=UPI00195B0D88|nr:wax ester/triacylglycerol synthase domain-containing protein [Geodermatophilus bullaregiensis]
MNAAFPPRLSPLDAYFLDVEPGGPAMNIGGLIVLERPDGVPALTTEALRARVLQRLPLLPRLRARVTPVPFHLAQPVWGDDRHFDIDRHVRAGPLDDPDGTGVAWSRILRAVEHTHHEPLDRAHPLWDMTLLPGTAPRQQVLHVRFHHALVDGMRAMALAVALFDRPEDYVKVVQVPAPPPVEPSATDLLTAIVAERGVRQLQRGLDLVLGALDPLAQLRQEQRTVETVLSFLGTPDAPRASLNGRVGPERRCRTAVVLTSDVARIRRRHHVTAHDVVLTLIAGALARLFAARGEPASWVRALVPMARPLPATDEPLGNHASICFVDLPIAPGRDDERLRAVAAAAAAAKHSPQLRSGAEFEGLTDEAPPLAAAWMARALADDVHVNLVVTYLRWSRRIPPLLGAQHIVTYPLLPLARRIGLFIGVVEAGGRLGLAVTTDPSILPEPGFLAHALRETAASLLR